VVGNADIIQGLRTLKTNFDYGIFRVVQKAAETALQLPESYILEAQTAIKNGVILWCKG
jgi:LL-diaminopimelate aminotransferase